MEQIDAQRFARDWAAAWNALDVEAVLSFFDDDAIFTSHIAIQIGFSDDGIMRGKEEIRRYWNKALAPVTGLRFEVVSVFAGVDTLVIVFRNQKGGSRAEVLTFSNGLVVSGHGTAEVA